MAVHRQPGQANLALDLSGLSLQLATIDPHQPAALGQRLVEMCASYIDTDRAALVLFGQRCGTIDAVYSTCQHLQLELVAGGHKVLEYVRSTRKALLVYDVNERPELRSAWSESYRTDAFAVLPLIFGRRMIGAVCLSNLSAQHLIRLENSEAQVQLVSQQLAQLALQLKRVQAKTPARLAASGDELELIASLLARLERGLDTRSVFALFCEMLEQYMHVDLLVMIHDRMRDMQQGVVVIQRPVHGTEVQSVLSNLAYQWQRRHKRAPLLEWSDSLQLGSELICDSEECPEELRLGGVETIPIFIDNDLFALVSISSDEATLADQRRMQMFSILIHQLMMHLKKGLLMAQNQEMQVIDTLTGLYNERHFYQLLEREFDRAKRYNVPLCLLIVDVDHFKDVNETYGFETGDLLLQELSKILMENTRNTDLVSRYSGERFIVVLPETHYKNSEILGNRLRRFIENHSFLIPNTNVFVKATVSVGVASYLDHKPAALAQFIEFADTALYFAKRNGRNQVVGYSFVIDLMLRGTEHQS